MTEKKRRPVWMGVGCLFETSVGGAKVLTGSVNGRQAVAVLGKSREGEPMWMVNVMSTAKDHAAALDLARHLIARHASAQTPPATAPRQTRGGRATLSLGSPMLETGR